MILMSATNKPFQIDKRLVYEAYKAVKSNKGAAGVDGQTIELFDADLEGNLYKIWNPMSSGIARWLTAPMEKEGILVERTRGTPQGGVISPILSNLFLHYAFDLWM